MGVETASIAANLARVRERIQRAASRASRNPQEITLVAVSKTFPAEAIRLAYAAGVRHFGENRVQEWESKQPALTDLDATWHLVGHLQSNKAARAARMFHAVDSLDRLELTQKLDRAVGQLYGSVAGEPGGRSSSSNTDSDSSVRDSASEDSVGAQHAAPLRQSRLQVLIEVRGAPEESKSGVAEADLPALAEAVVALPHLDLCGLMCIPPYHDDPEKVRPYFRKLRELRDALRRHLAGHSEGRPCRPEESLLPELSMGMSHDFEVAIEEGATQVRLGTAIFGLRADAI